MSSWDIWTIFDLLFISHLTSHCWTMNNINIIFLLYPTWYYWSILDNTNDIFKLKRRLLTWNHKKQKWVSLLTKTWFNQSEGKQNFIATHFVRWLSIPIPFLLYHSLSNRSFSKMWICNIIIHTISLSFYIAHNTAERKTGSNQADTKPYFPNFSMILHTYPKIQKIQIFKARLSVKHFSFTNDVIQKLFI